MKSQYFTATMYTKQDARGYMDGCAGITFFPTPSLTCSEVFAMADDLMALAKSMKAGYVLSYVNLPINTKPKETIIYDKEFDTIIRLMDFVNTTHPNYTSYQIIVWGPHHENVI